MAACRNLVAFLFFLAVSVTGVRSRSFIITNNCAYTVWPGILSGAGSAALDSTGFELEPGQSQTLSAPAGWSGRMWGRTLCSADGPTTGKFACATGDCGSGRVECSGGGPAPPASLAEFTLDGSGGMDFYDVSLVDGYNLPLLVAPQGGNCAPTGCMVDLNGACPADLRVTAGGGVACRSACEAFGSAQCCCSGEYGNPNTCKPTAYSQFFKNACPSYAYDDATSTFTCGGAGTDYSIAFCPNTSSVKSSSPGLPLINNTMTYFGGSQIGAAGASRPQPVAVLLGGVVLLAFTRAFF